MIKIRKNIFETNSSSIHAICVSSKPVDARGLIVHLRIGNFGWEHEWYRDIDSRASYIYTAACCIYGRDFYNDFRKLLEPYGIEVNKDWNNEAKFNTFDNGDSYLANGYIDHVDELNELVDRCLSDVDTLIRFIFSDESFVMTTNDNCDYTEEKVAAQVEAGNNEIYWK